MDIKKAFLKWLNSGDLELTPEERLQFEGARRADDLAKLKNFDVGGDVFQLL